MTFESLNIGKQQLLVKLEGDMDALGCTKIRKQLEQLANSESEQPHIITTVALDMSQVSFLDSSGIGAIVFLFKRLKTSGRKLSIIGVRGQPLELMELLRISSAIPVNSSSL